MRRIPRILLILCASFALVGLLGRSEFFIGTVYAAARWPVVLLGLVLFLGFARGRHRIATIVSLSVAVLVASEGLWVRAARADPQSPDSGGSRIDVVSFNLLFRGGAPERSLKTLKAAAADVLVLQEVTPVWEKRLREAFLVDYPYQTFDSDTGTHGFAILSKRPIGEVATLDNDAGRGIAQCAEVGAGNSSVYLCNVHLASPAGALKHRSLPEVSRNASRRASEWAQLQAFVDAHATSPRRMIAGDLNTMEFDPLYRDITETWVDVFRHQSASLGATWPNLHQKTIPLFRIDYVLVSGPMLPESASVVKLSGSDHLPLKAGVRL